MNAFRLISHANLTLATVCLVLLLKPGAVMAYGGYGYHHGYGHHGHHYGFHAHYSSHGGVGTAGYVILGLLGVAVLSHILDNDRYYRSRPVARTEPLPEYRRSTHRPAPYPRLGKTTAGKPMPVFGSHEGWLALDNDDPARAMQIFAVQSQQNLYSGVPKIGFALAAASKGELERGIWSMRKAVASDPGALDHVVIDAELQQLIDDLSSKYQSDPAVGTPGSYRSFMIAALSYLRRDIPAARTHIAFADNSRSSDNLRALIESAAE